MASSALVFFASGDWRRPGQRPITARRIANAARRRPRRAWAAFLTWLIRALTRGPAHLAVGDEFIVLDPGLRGDRLWPTERFVESYPTLIEMIEVPLSHRPILTLRMRKKPRSAWPTLIHWATRGLTPVPDDCLRRVVTILRDGGVAVPRVRTPLQLQRWLHEQQYPATPLV